MAKKWVLFFLLILLPKVHFAQFGDSLHQQKDSVLPAIQTSVNQYVNAWQTILARNAFINNVGTPVLMLNSEKADIHSDIKFYFLSGIMLIFAFIKFFYSKYFDSLFKFFFNSTLRQNQLTDQLLQANLPSLLFNLFFIISGGTYIYFLLLHFQVLVAPYQWLWFAGCILLLGAIYFVKFSSLKFIGWVSGNPEIADTYIFIIFLVAKILGILLIPLITLIAFSSKEISSVTVIVSFILIGILFLVRYFKSYGLIQNQLKINSFHFFLYLTGLEILPVLLIYKAILILFNKTM